MVRNARMIIQQSDESIIHLKNADWKLGCLIDSIGDIECNIHSDGYSFLIGEIVGQMLSNKVADIMFERIKESCEGDICPERIIQISINGLRSSGISKTKSECIIQISEMVLEGKLNIESLYKKSDDEVYRILTSIKGIGAWTAKMFLLFAKQSQDILPFEDGAFLQTYKWLYNTTETSPESVKKNCERWSPYSSIASRYFYRALDMGMTNKNVNLILGKEI